MACACSILHSVFNYKGLQVWSYKDFLRVLARRTPPISADSSVNLLLGLYQITSEYQRWSCCFVAFSLQERSTRYKMKISRLQFNQTWTLSSFFLLPQLHSLVQQKIWHNGVGTKRLSLLPKSGVDKSNIWGRIFLCSGICFSYSDTLLSRKEKQIIIFFGKFKKTVNQTSL